MFALVEKNNHNAIHGLFDSIERANWHLVSVIPDYCKKGFFSDKTLTPESFEVIERTPEQKQKRKAR